MKNGKTQVFPFSLALYQNFRTVSAVLFGAWTYVTTFVWGIKSPVCIVLFPSCASGYLHPTQCQYRIVLGFCCKIPRVGSMVVVRCGCNRVQPQPQYHFQAQFQWDIRYWNDANQLLLAAWIEKARDYPRAIDGWLHIYLCWGVDFIQVDPPLWVFLGSYCIVQYWECWYPPPPPTGTEVRNKSLQQLWKIQTSTRTNGRTISGHLYFWSAKTLGDKRLSGKKLKKSSCGFIFLS